MNEQEMKDLEEMKAMIRDKKVSTFDYLTMVSRYNEIDLLHSSYRGKTIAQAMEAIVLSAMKDIKKLTDNYIRKYPDDK